IINEMNALRTASHRFDNFPRAVGGHSVNHHDFHTIRRVILRHHGAQAAGDVMSLISDGQNDAHQRSLPHGHDCTLACRHSIHPPHLPPGCPPVTPSATAPIVMPPDAPPPAIVGSTPSDATGSIFFGISIATPTARASPSYRVTRGVHPNSSLAATQG